MSAQDKYQILLDAVFCVMAADGKVAKQELAAITEVLAKVHAPLGADEINIAAKSFVARVRASSLRQVLDETIASVTLHGASVSNRQAFLEMLTVVAEADGEFGKRERYVVGTLRKAINSNVAPDISDLLEEVDQQPRQQPTAPLSREHDPSLVQCSVCGARFRMWLSRKVWTHDSETGRSDYYHMDYCPSCDAPRPQKCLFDQWSEWWSEFQRFG